MASIARHKTVLGRGKRVLPGAALICGLVLAGCAPQPMGKVGEPPAAGADAPRPEAPESREYRLGSGDRLKVDVLGQDEISGEYEISNTGTLAMRLVGEIEVGNMTIADLQHSLTVTLAREYLVDPLVTIEVLNYRPFFILGAVNRPGSYPYVGGIDARMAVAIAGGFTRRALDTSVVLIRKDEAGAEVKYRVGLEIPVLPGDTLEVERRLF